MKKFPLTVEAAGFACGLAVALAGRAAHTPALVIVGLLLMAACTVSTVTTIFFGDGGPREHQALLAAGAALTAAGCLHYLLHASDPDFFFPSLLAYLGSGPIIAGALGLAARRRRSGA